MKNYDLLIEREAEKKRIVDTIGEEAFMQAEPDHDLLVKRVSTGQEGYVESYARSSNVSFTVPSEDLAEYQIKAETFNQDFVIKQEQE